MYQEELLIAQRLAQDNTFGGMEVAVLLVLTPMAMAHLLQHQHQSIRSQSAPIHAERINISTGILLV